MNEFEKNFNADKEDAVDDESKAVDPYYSVYDGFFDGAITSPVVAGADHAMVLIISGGAQYIGGLIEVSDTGSVTLSYPMSFMEAFVPSNVPDAGEKLTIMMSKPVVAINLPKSMWFAASGIIPLKSANSSDSRLVQAYEKNVNSVLSADIGIYSPSSADIANIRRG